MSYFSVFFFFNKVKQFIKKRKECNPSTKSIQEKDTQKNHKQIVMQCWLSYHYANMNVWFPMCLSLHMVHSKLRRKCSSPFPPAAMSSLHYEWEKSYGGSSMAPKSKHGTMRCV
jgi:hypothetical protein